MKLAWSKPKFFTSWSFSRLQAWRQCPLKAKLSNIDKIKEPPKPDDHPMVRGDRIHKLAEAYIKGETGGVRTLPPVELMAFKEEFRQARKLRKQDPEVVPVEETWAFRKDWTITTYDDWDNCWLRVKVDFAVIDDCTVYINDIKTGKFSPQYNVEEYTEQLELYCLAALIMYADIGPELRVIPRLWYTDAGIVYPSKEGEAVMLEELPRLKKKWEKIAKPMLADRTFAPKPNRFCSSCHYRKGNAERTDGGQVCRFN